MSRRVVLLFAGQGAQKVGMGKDLAEAYPAAAQIFSEADSVLAMNLTEVMFEGPMETLTRTSYCQPALFVHGLVCLRLVQDRVPDLEIAACAGLSLGEFTAHAAAGSFSFADGLRLVAARGRFMDEACAQTDGAMAALIGGEAAGVLELAQECGIDVANFNAPGQIVVSGTRTGVARAVERAKSKGIRAAKLLPVAGAYHSRLMRSAQQKLAAKLAPTEIHAPRIPVVSNVTAQPVNDPAEIRRTLEDQVTGAVRWSDSMEFLLAQGFGEFLELGPGGVLAGLMGRIDKSAEVTSVENVTGLDRLAGMFSQVSER
ncbi:MAG: ACP S-malonyltransferase [Verrucomicrobiales bacterium]